MKHLELFSGIGGFRRALDLLDADGLMRFDCVGYSEINKYAKKTYQTNYNTDGEIDIGDIVNLTESRGGIATLPHFDLLTGGFPCQAFSSLGRKKGFADDRGQMFFRIMDIVRIKRPRYILLENVRGLISHDNGNTLKVILSQLENGGYNVSYTVLNAADFGIPQNRRRIIIFATTENIDCNFFTAENITACFKQNNPQSVCQYKTTLDILDKDVALKYYLSDALKRTILADSCGGYKSKAKINLLTARPLTATMHKSHRASQDNYYDDMFIQSEGRINHALDYTKEQQERLNIRKITPEEAFVLQGFPKEFALKARQNGVSDTQLYMQAGNAVCVNMIYAVMLFLINEGIVKED